MNVLMVHQHFRYPEEGGAIRSYYLARALIKNGHTVTVLTRGNGIRKPSVENIDGIEAHYLPIEYHNEMSFPKRILVFFSFVAKAIIYSKKIDIGRHSLCYCISTPLTSGIIGLWLRWKYKLPYIFEVGDLWPDAPIAMGAMNFPLAKTIAKKLEKSIYANSIGVVGLSPDIVERIKERTRKPVYYVPNFADTDFFTPVQKRSYKPFIISYTGALGRANGLEYLLEAAMKAQSSAVDVEFNIMGEGAVYDFLTTKAKSLKLNNISFLPFGNKESVKLVLDKSDAIYVSYKKLEILETGSPNKFFDGLAAGRMVILNFEGWLAKYVKEYSCGFNYDPEKPEQFIEKLQTYLSNPVKLDEAKMNARNLAEQKFALNDWEGRFVEILKIG